MNQNIFGTLETFNHYNQMALFRHQTLLGGLTEADNSVNSLINRGKGHKFSKWTPEEDRQLRQIVESQNNKNWKKVSEHFINKSAIQCFYRWSKVIKPSFDEKEWTDEEDDFILKWVARFGISNWTNCSKILKGRTPKSCKDRWNNILSVNYQKETFWNTQDDTLLLIAVESFGTSWSKIKKLFPGRKENDIKNKFYSLLRKTASNHLNRTSSGQRINVFQLKLNDLINFLPVGINDIRLLLGEGMFTHIKEKFEQEYMNLQGSVQMSEPEIMSHDCLRQEKTETNTKINICFKCMTSLREEIKKKLLSRLIKNNLSKDSIPHISELFGDVSRLESTKDKIQTIKSILSNFTQNLTKS